MIEIGRFLLSALFAGLLYWLVDLLCRRFGAPHWLTMILSGATLVYFFWLFSTIGPITIGK
jgi:hypothetical protein